MRRGGIPQRARISGLYGERARRAFPIQINFDTKKGKEKKRLPHKVRK